MSIASSYGVLRLPGSKGFPGCKEWSGSDSNAVVKKGRVRRVDKSLINGAEEGDFEVVNNLQVADQLV